MCTVPCKTKVYQFTFIKNFSKSLHLVHRSRGTRLMFFLLECLVKIPYHLVHKSKVVFKFLSKLHIRWRSLTRGSP
jgi:hypothetical protein